MPVGLDKMRNNAVSNSFILSDYLRLNHSPVAVAPSRRTTCCETLQKLLRNGQRNMTESSRHQLGLQVLQTPIWTSVCWTFWNKSDSRRIRLGSDPSRHGQKNLWDSPPSKQVECPVAPIVTYTPIPKTTWRLQLVKSVQEKYLFGLETKTTW